MKKLSKMFESKTNVGECIMEFALNVFCLKCQCSLCTLGYLFVVLCSTRSYKILGDIYVILYIKLMGLREMS